MSKREKKRRGPKLKKETQPSRKSRKKIFFFVIVAGSLIFLELILRIAGYIYEGKYRSDETSSEISQYLSDEYYRILTVGESTTVGLWVDDMFSYPRQLERMLNECGREKKYKVFKKAGIGSNTFLILSKLERSVEDISPHLVILMVGANDFWSIPKNIIYAEVSKTKKIIFSISSFLEENLKTYKVAKWIVFKIFNPKGQEKFYNGLQDIEYHKFASMHHTTFMNVIKRNIKQMIELARKVGAEVVLSTYPMAVLMGYRDVRPISPLYFEIAKEEGVAVADNFLVFNSYGREVLSLLKHDRWHPNETGYTLLSLNILYTISKRRIIPDHERCLEYSVKMLEKLFPKAAEVIAKN